MDVRNKDLEAVLSTLKTTLENRDNIGMGSGDWKTVESTVELLEELKFRREHTDLLEDHESTDGYVCDDGRVIKSGQRYRHFKKGNIYIVVIPCVYDTEDMKEYVIYRGGDNKRRMWARPVEEFMSEVDRNKYPQATQQYRFELIEDGEENGL